MKTYYCKHCKKTFKRSGKRRWVKTFCEQTGKDTHAYSINRKQIKMLPEGE